ncbi:hypothetical protein Plhal304r1_c015g0055121 [Plasmopara halstedii]
MTTTSFVRSGIHAVQLLISIDWHARDRQTSISRHRVAQRTDFLSSEGLIFGVELTFTHLLESCTLVSVSFHKLLKSASGVPENNNS